jgi:PEP-CTERM motif
MRSVHFTAPALVVLALSFAPARAGSQFLSVDLSGTVQNTTSGPLQIQVGPAAFDSTGTTLVEGNPALNGAPASFSNYVASAGLPQVSPGDLPNYGMAIYGSATSQVGNVDTFSGTFRLYAPGLGYSANDGQILDHGTFNGTVTFSDSSDTFGVVAGTFLSDPGSFQPPGFPVAVDFYPANPLAFNGTYSVSAGVATLSGNLRTVPEPGSLSLAGICLGGLALRAWRRRAVA